MEENMDDELHKSAAILEDFLTEVNKLEGSLAGGQKLELGKGGEALNSLRETKIELGNPRDKLFRLTSNRLKEVGFNLQEIHKRQQSDTYNFYYITVPINLFGSPGVEFDDLICELDFEPKGEQEPIIQALFPTGEWHEVMSYGAGATLTINADYGFDMGLNLDEEELSKLRQRLPGSITWNVQNKSTMKGIVVIPDFKFSIGRKEIAAAGLQNSHCRWIISAPELHQADNMEFGIVFKVLKECVKIELTAKVTAQPSMSWLAAQLRHLAKSLVQRFQNVIRGSEPMVMGAAEKWSLTLPD
jgi:hypothetical protein